MNQSKARSIWDRVCFALFFIILIFLIISVILVLPWRWYAPPITAFMLYEKLTHDIDIQYEWVPIDKISPNLAIAAIASEDQKFPNHIGFDFESIQSAISEDRSRIRGASTISQQLAKNLYLWPSRSYLRKVIEAYFTVLIELLWNKQRILEIYLNIIELGQGIYGAEAASQKFYGKSAEKLTISEASIMVAVLPNPKEMRVDEPSNYVLKRARRIQKNIRNLGGIEYLDYLDEK